MKKNSNAKKRLLEARREADAILASGANRLLLIESILVVCVFVALFVSLQSGATLLLTLLTENAWIASLLFCAASLTYLLLVIFFAAPVVLGLFRLAEQLQAKKAPVLMDLFYYLSSSERYLYGLHITRPTSIKLLLVILTVNAIHFLCPIAWLSGILKAVVTLLAIIWVLLPYSKLNDLLKGKDKPHRIGGGIRLVWFFTPWLLLGFVSIGLLLVLDVFPRMLLTYFCDCNRNDTPIDL